eukprot:INCI12738.1.p1 GENE.INCI12738.1~~INCI12738.1.p1  ORF type:complete len:496 (+),score=97.97 INCI12738.1:204-1691(+)
MNCEKEAIKRFLREQNIHAPLDDGTLLNIVSSLSSANISTLDIPALLHVSAEEINRASSAAVAPWWQDKQKLTPTRKSRPASHVRENDPALEKTKRKQKNTKPQSTSLTSGGGRASAMDTNEETGSGPEAKPTGSPQDIWSKYKIEARPWRKHMSTKPKPPSPEKDVSIWEKYNIEERPWKHKMSKTARPPVVQEPEVDRATLRQSRPRPWTRCMKATSRQQLEASGDDSENEHEGDNAATNASTAAEDLDRSTRRQQRPRPWVANMKTAKAEPESEPEKDRRAQREARARPWQSHMRKKPKARRDNPAPTRAELRANRPRPWSIATSIVGAHSDPGTIGGDAGAGRIRSDSREKKDKKAPVVSPGALKAVADVSLDSTVASAQTDKDPMKLVAEAANADGSGSGTDSEDYNEDDYSNDPTDDDAGHALVKEPAEPREPLSAPESGTSGSDENGAPPAASTNEQDAEDDGSNYSNDDNDFSQDDNDDDDDYSQDD